MSSTSPPVAEKPNYPPFYAKTSLIQIAYGLWMNMVSVSHGLSLGYSAVVVPQLQGFHNMKLTVEEQSWITSVSALTQPVGCLVAGWMTDAYGRRFTMVVGQVPAALGWLFMAFVGDTPGRVIFGRVVNGFGSGMSLGPPRTFVTEITLPNMRGVLGAVPNVANSLGLVVQAGLGSVLKLKTICIICGVYCILLMIANCFLPESPYYLLMKGEVDKAKSSLAKFRDKNYAIDKEMATLIKFKEQNSLHKLTWKESIRALFKPTAYKPFIVFYVFFIFGQLSGIGVTTYWTVTLLKDSKLSMDAYSGNVVLAMTRLFGGCLVVLLLYKLRRRSLSMTSSIGSGVSYFFGGMYLQFATRDTLYPLLFYQSFIIFASLGYFALPFLIVNELCPLQIRGLLGGISVASASIVIFGANKSYPFIRLGVSMAAFLMALGVNSFIGTVYLYLFLPETKNSTLVELQKFYGEGGWLAKRLEKQHNVAASNVDSSETQQANASTSTDGKKRREP